MRDYGYDGGDGKTASNFTYGLGNPAETRITKPGQSLPSTVKTQSTNSYKSPISVSSAKLKQLEKMDEYYDRQAELYQESLKPTEVKVNYSNLVASKPPVVDPPPPPPPPPPIKTATPQYILGESDIVPLEIMTDLIFENIGGQELIEITRHDIINGDYVSNQLVKNLTKIKQEYDPKKIFSLSNTSDRYFENFSIKLNNKIPNVGNGALGQNVYVDENNNDIVIDLVNIEKDEQVEIQISIDGTIYEVTI